MATIKSSLVLNDRMSAVLNRINVALNTTVDCCESVATATGQAVDVHQWDAARVAISEANASIQEMQTNYRGTVAGQDNLNRKIYSGNTAANGLIRKIASLVSLYGIARGAGSLLNASDEIMQTTARLNLMNDGLQSTGDLLNMVHSSAQNARGSLSSMAAVVTRIGNNVGIGEDKVFGSSAEVVAFSELIQKQMTIAGASAAEAENAILQLSQGLASGALRGDELRSVAEQAPGIIQNIADYLGVTTGEIRDMASEGQITADVVKNAMFNAADEINNKFEAMPMTWEQVCQSMENSAQMLFVRPVSQKIQDIIATDEFKGVLTEIQNVFVPLANIVIELLDSLANAAFFVSENFSFIAPVIGGIVSVLGLYTIALGANKVQLIAVAAAQAFKNFEEYRSAKALVAAASAAGVNTAALLGEAGAETTVAATAAAAAAGFNAQSVATAQATVAQASFNTVLLASPLFWIPAIIIGIVVLLYSVIAIINRVKGTTISATGIICGIINVAIAIVKNLIIGWANYVIGCVITLYNGFVDFANGIAMMFVNPIDGAKQLFFGLLDYVLGVMQAIAGAIDSVFGSNLSGAVAGWRNSVSAKAETVINTELANPLKKKDAADYMIERVQYSDAWNSGYNFGGNIEAGLKDTIGGLFDVGSGIMPTIAPDVSSIAGDTGNISDSLDKTNEELSWIRDIAEREVINRFTTAEVKVDFTGMTNQISNDMDLDGVISAFTGKFKESLQTAAEGVY